MFALVDLIVCILWFCVVCCGLGFVGFSFAVLRVWVCCWFAYSTFDLWFRLIVLFTLYSVAGLVAWSLMLVVIFTIGCLRLRLVTCSFYLGYYWFAICFVVGLFDGSVLVWFSFALVVLWFCLLCYFGELCCVIFVCCFLIVLLQSFLYYVYVVYVCRLLAVWFWCFSVCVAFCCSLVYLVVLCRAGRVLCLVWFGVVGRHYRLLVGLGRTYLND